MARVFLCHSSKDKPFVEHLALNLRSVGLEVWYDQWEIRVGDSIAEKIDEGIKQSDFLVIVLSKSSVRSKWARKELDAGLAKEIDRKGAFVLPILAEICSIPQLLRGKRYVNFADSPGEAMQELVNAILARSSPKQWSGKVQKRFYAPMASLPTDGVRVGTGTHPTYKSGVDIRISSDDRKRHMYIVGQTGTGKSKMMVSMLTQDIEEGRGVGLIDPHGDVVEATLSKIPDARRDDVVLFDPSDVVRCVGINFLETGSDSEVEQNDIVQEIIATLLRSVDYDLNKFGPRAQQLTHYGCMTLMGLPKDSRLSSTLLDVPRLFSDEEFRQAVLSEIANPALKQFWASEFEPMDNQSKHDLVAYVSSKFLPFVATPQLRNIVGQRKSGINFREIVNRKKIFLMDLAFSKIGRRNAEILGSMLFGRLLWTAVNGDRHSPRGREDFYFYVDEFQHFVTDKLADFLFEARDYGLCLTIAHQHLGQLQAMGMGRVGQELERAILGKIGTIVAFRTGSDADSIANTLGKPAESSILRELEYRHAVIKILIDGVPSAPFMMKTLEWVSPESADIQRGQIIRQSARKRGRPVGEVEAEIRRRYEKE